MSPSAVSDTVASSEAGLGRQFAVPPVVLVITALLVGVAAAFALHGLANPLGTDYLAVVTGARVLAEHAPCLYCDSTQINVEQQLLHQPLGGFDAFFGSPVQAVAARPLLALTPQAGFAVFVGLSFLAVAASCIALWKVLGLRANGGAGLALLVLAALSLPSAWNYWLAQWDALLLLPAVGAVTLLTAKGRTTLAGVALSVLLFKPQTVWLLPVVLVIARQWRLLTGMVLGGAALVASSLVLVSARALADWLPFVLARGPKVDTSIGIPGVVALLAGNQSAVIATSVAGLLLAAACWPVRRELAAQPVLAVALGLTVSALAAPHIFPYDLVILSVPICILATRRFQRALACAALLNISYLVDWSFTHTGLAETIAVLALGLCIFAEARLPHLEGASCGISRPQPRKAYR